jgi:hypothetical protein
MDSPRMYRDGSRHYGATLLPQLLLLSCFVCCLIGTPASLRAATSDHVIVLASSPGTNLDWNPKPSPLFNGRRLFITQITVKGQSWERLNLGFFKSYEQASSLLPDIRKLYRGAWISTSNVNDSRRFIDPAATPAIDVKSVAHKPPATRAALSDNRFDSLMTRAKSAFKLKKYPEAIRLFSALTQSQDSRYSQQALELLGLSRQRNGQNSHAFEIYTRYLQRYTEGDGPKRVRQRLAGLVTETKAPRESIRMSSTRDDGEFITYGSWSQFYRRDRTNIENTGTLTTGSQLTSFIDLTAIKRSAGISHKGQFTADDSHDFLDNGDGNEFRFIEMYYEIAARESGTSARLGRQPLRVGGMLRRFDGISGGWQFTPDLRLNLLAGYPVDINNRSSINTDKKFYGFTLETGTFLKHWNLNFFHFQQYVFDIEDFTSTGVEVHYADGAAALFGMVDYDSIYSTLNIVQLNANLNLSHARSVYLNAFVRRNPLLTTSNALIGRQESSIEALQQTLNIEQIHQLALDRSAKSRTFTIGGIQPLNEKYQITGDITLSSIDATVASGGVAATPALGTDYYYSLQLVGNSLYMENDTIVLGLRYLATDPSDTLSLIANTRFPITRNWRINPRIQFDTRHYTGGGTQYKWRTLLRTDYRYGRSLRFDFELGYDDISQNSSGTLGSNNLFFTLGYRWDF